MLGASNTKIYNLIEKAFTETQQNKKLADPSFKQSMIDQTNLMDTASLKLIRGNLTQEKKKFIEDENKSFDEKKHRLLKKIKDKTQ